MKTLFIDCGMGASGDMLTAALLELIPDRDAFIKRMNSIGIPGVEVKMESCVKCGITGTHVTVTVNGEEETETLHEHHHGHEHNHDHDHEQHHHDHHDHDHDHEHEHHHHSGIHDIMHIVNELAIPQQVKENVMAVYKLIAEAESKVHGVPVTDIHFHEVGTMDAIADRHAASESDNRIAGACGKRPCQVRTWSASGPCACDRTHSSRHTHIRRKH